MCAQDLFASLEMFPTGVWRLNRQLPQRMAGRYSWATYTRHLRGGIRGRRAGVVLRSTAMPFASSWKQIHSRGYAVSGDSGRQNLPEDIGLVPAEVLLRWATSRSIFVYTWKRAPVMRPEKSPAQQYILGMIDGMRGSILQLTTNMRMARVGETGVSTTQKRVYWGRPRLFSVLMDPREPTCT